MFENFLILSQLTGNFKESIIPYIKENMKQERLIDKSKKEDLNSEPNKEILNDLERLQLYSKNFSKNTKETNNNNIEEDERSNQSNTDETQSVTQAEVESLMPNVIYLKKFFLFIYYTL